MGHGSTPSGSQSAFGVIVEQPFGRAILGICAVGLLGYLLWRVIDAIKDASGKGSDAKGLAVRTATFFKGLVYGVLGLEAMRFALRGSGSGQGGDSSSQHWLGRVMSLPFGKYLAMGVGIGVLIYAVYQLWAAWTAKLSDDLELGRMSSSARSAAIAVSRAGIAARAVVFMIIGYFLLHSAMRSDPGEAKALHGALVSLQDEKYGTLLLVVIGLGLAAYGVYALINARYRRIRV